MSSIDPHFLTLHRSLEGALMADTKKQKKVHSKADIINLVTDSVKDVSKTAVTKVIDATLEAIKKAIASDKKVILIGFGTLKQGERKARVGRNPKTGKEIKISAAKTIRFTAGKGFKDLVNK